MQTRYTDMTPAWRRVVDAPTAFYAFIAVRDGEPVHVASVWIRHPRDGAGRLRTVVLDRGPVDAPWPESRWYTGAASGYGYDKVTAAIAGATIAGVAVGDHCNRHGHPTWEQIEQRVSGLLRVGT